MIYMFLMFLAWGLREVTLMPTWVCIVLTVLTVLDLCDETYQRGKRK